MAKLAKTGPTVLMRPRGRCPIVDLFSRRQSISETNRIHAVHRMATTIDQYNGHRFKVLRSQSGIIFDKTEVPLHAKLITHRRDGRLGILTEVTSMFGDEFHSRHDSPRSFPMMWLSANSVGV